MTRKEVSELNGLCEESSEMFATEQDRVGILPTLALKPLLVEGLTVHVKRLTS